MAMTVKEAITLLTKRAASATYTELQDAKEAFAKGGYKGLVVTCDDLQKGLLREGVQ